MRLGDLDALKQTFAEYGEKAKFTQGACQQLIDNAQTIEEKSYAMGFQDGLEDGLQDIREQGDWIKVKEERMMVDMSGEIVTRYKCSECGRMITILPSRLAEYPFCHCGAAMQKGGTE